MNSIFISIAAYRDPLLENTVLEAYKQAEHKDRLVFGIVDQSFDREYFNWDRLPFRDQVRYIRIDPIQTRGCCFARNLSQSLWAGEQLYFQCDSHTLFDANWDSIFEQEFFRLHAYHHSPIITAYPRGFKALNNDIKTLERQTLTGSMTLAVDPKTHFKDDYFIGTVAKVMDYTDTVPGFLISANCLFTWGKVCEEVPYDPYLFFHGEEHSLALRMWTQGYNIFHMPLTPVYHHYGRDYRKTFWGDQHVEQQRGPQWWELDKLSKSRLKYIVTGQRGGQYGVGKIRSIQDYAEYSGINYILREVSEAALTGVHVYTRDWRASQ